MIDKNLYKKIPINKKYSPYIYEQYKYFKQRFTKLNIEEVLGKVPYPKEFKQNIYNCNVWHKTIKKMSEEILLVENWNKNVKK